MRHEFIIVAYGSSPHLGDCIDSILGQTKIPASLCVATSTPNEHIRRTAALRGVAVLRNPVPDGGIAVDWNFALSLATRELVTLAHQDDLYASYYSEAMLSAMARHQNSLIGFSDFEETSQESYCWDSVNNKVKRWLTRRAFGSKEAIGRTSEKRKLLSLGNPVCCPSVIFNRANLGQFEFASGFKSNLDWEAWLQLSRREGSFVYVPEVLVKKRNHGHSATASLISSRRRLHEDRAMFERLWPKPVAAVLMQFYRLGYIGNERAPGPRNELPGNEQHT